MKRAYIVALLAACGCGSSSGNPSSPGQDSGASDTGAPEVGTSMDSGGAMMEGGAGDAASEGGPGTCTADWCWLPPPQTSPSLSGIWGSSAMDIWVTGDGGVLVHWDG